MFSGWTSISVASWMMHCIQLSWPGSWCPENGYCDPGHCSAWPWLICQIYIA
jgi:hypothetical protein